MKIELSTHTFLLCGQMKIHQQNTEKKNTRKNNNQKYWKKENGTRERTKVKSERKNCVSVTKQLTMYQRTANTLTEHRPREQRAEWRERKRDGEKKTGTRMRNTLTKTKMHMEHEMCQNSNAKTQTTKYPQIHNPHDR